MLEAGPSNLNHSEDITRETPINDAVALGNITVTAIDRLLKSFQSADVVVASNIVNYLGYHRFQ